MRQSFASIPDSSRDINIVKDLDIDSIRTIPLTPYVADSFVTNIASCPLDSMEIYKNEDLTTPYTNDLIKFNYMDDTSSANI